MQGHFVNKNIFMQSATPRILTKLVSAGVGLGMILWLLAQVELSSAIRIIRDAPLYKILLGFLCYGASFYVRAIRFRLLLPPQVRLTRLFPIVLMHYTALNIIPARLGELSYVYLLQKVHDVPTGQSVSSLLLARVFDHIAVSILFLVSYCSIDFMTPWLQTLSLVVGTLLIVSVVMLMLLLKYKAKTLTLLRWGVATCKWEHSRVVQRILRETEEVISGLNRIESKAMAGKILGYSLVIWLNMFGLNYILLSAFGVHLSYLEVVLARTFTILITIIPIQVVNGIGVRQTTWAFIALAMGVPTKSAAIVSAFSSRIIATVYLAIFGFYGFWHLKDLLQNAPHSHTHE